MLARHGERGLSMIEVMVALAILAVGFLALLQSVLGSSRLSTHSQEDAEALLIAENKVEELKAAAPTYGGYTPDFSTLIATYTQQTASLQDLQQPLAAAISTRSSTLAGPNAPHGQSGWGTAPVISTVAGFKEIGSRLKNVLVTIHFLDETEFANTTGIRDPGVTDTPAVAAGSRPDPIDLVRAAGNTPATKPDASYSFLPVKVTVSWTSVDGSPRSLELLTAILPRTPRAP